MNNVTQISEAKEYFAELQKVLKILPVDGVDRIADTLMQAYRDDRTVFLFGNGGSASLASHLACDLGKGTAGYNPEKRFRVHSLADNMPTLTAWANDSCYEDVFAEQLKNFLKPGDVVLAISGSGNSKNVLSALRVAKDGGATTLGLTGFKGGEMKFLCDVCVVVPSDDMQIIEDLHLAMSHSVFRIISARISRRTMLAAQSG